METKCAEVHESKLVEDYEDEGVDEVCRGVANVQVVENENRRKRAVSYFPKEVVQVCKDICAYFDAHDDAPSTGRQDAVDRVPGPEALRTLLLSAKSQADVWFYEYRLLSPGEVNRRKVTAAAADLVPFAENIDGDLLCTGADDHDGGVYAVRADDDEINGEQEAPSLATFLERYRDTILSGRLEYIEDCGMVERCAAVQDPTAGAERSADEGDDDDDASSSGNKNMKK